MLSFEQALERLLAAAQPVAEIRSQRKPWARVVPSRSPGADAAAAGVNCSTRPSPAKYPASRCASVVASPRGDTMASESPATCTR